VAVVQVRTLIQITAACSVSAQLHTVLRVVRANRAAHVAGAPSMVHIDACNP
jgi:hypothetical protein